MHASYAASAAMGIYNTVWRSLSSLYLDDMSPSQHLAVMIATAVTVVAVLVGGCWTYRQRRGSSDNGADSSDNLRADGNIIIIVVVIITLHNRSTLGLFYPIVRVSAFPIRRPYTLA